ARLTILKHRRSKPWPSVHAMRRLADPSSHAAAKPCGPAREKRRGIILQAELVVKAKEPTGRGSVWADRGTGALAGVFFSEGSHSRGALHRFTRKTGACWAPGCATKVW